MWANAGSADWRLRGANFMKFPATSYLIAARTIGFKSVKKRLLKSIFYFISATINLRLMLNLGVWKSGMCYNATESQNLCDGHRPPLNLKNLIPLIWKNSVNSVKIL